MGLRLPRPKPENKPSYVSLACGAAGMAAAVVAAVLLAPASAGGAPMASAPVTDVRAWAKLQAAVPTKIPEESPATTTKPHKTAATTPKTQSQPHKKPQAPPAQRADTVRLASGGTATLVRTDVGPDGVLPIPIALDQATWWGSELNDRTGATVLAGHVNWHGQTGPFDELWRARVNDPVTIVDPDGHTLRFRVVQLVTLHKDELPRRAAELFAQKGPHRLVLVTCGGQWVGGEMGYASNRVVIAEPVH
jgi:hypothetical protein